MEMIFTAVHSHNLASKFRSRGTQSQSSHDGGAARGRTTSLIKSENERWTCEDIHTSAHQFTKSQARSNKK